MSQTDQVISWLNSAYAMEQAQIQVLENHAQDAGDFPSVRSRDEQHIEETKRHADRVKYCLQLLDASPSTTKSVVGSITGMVQGASSGMYKDELVKNFLSDYASEHFEIACYRSLIAAAHAIGRPEIAEICREILQDEEAMAEWLAQNIPTMTETFLRQETVRS
ncbi:hypothetical protein DB347_05535 [Opitutaceae bacterium EW11]|nr:hypothetical protein DB347_05535 [Opitutaceae bacterium EW11]